MTTFPTLVPRAADAHAAADTRTGTDGTALVAVPRTGEPFLLLTAIERGIGSSGLWLDRGQPGDVRLVHAEVVGSRLLLVQDNKHFTVVSDDPDAVAAARDSFATSVVWSADVLESHDDHVVVDAASLATSDLLRVSARLAGSQQGDLRLDPARSVLVTATTGPSAPGTVHGSVELSGLLTFAGRGEGALLTQVSPDPDVVSLTQRVSLTPLPSGFVPRTSHPGSGGYGKGYADHAAPGGASVDVRWQPRFRLEKTDPGAASSPVVEPVVLSVDPAIPEPYRSAVLEGGRWWSEGFAAAGLEDAFRVELRTPDVDPFAARTSSLWWVHRTNRGWSQGAALTDPRTGEILSARVRLGSQRVHQLTLVAEGLLSPYGRPDEAARLAAVEALVLARVRQLAAHEIGHALGFMHNYASTQHSQASVMDYPHPHLRLGADGEIDVSDAYPVGLGPWDVLAVRQAYEPLDPADEAAALTDLRRTAAEQGLTYLTDADGHDPEAASPDAVPWVHGADPLASLENLLAVRAKALADFGPGVVAPGRQAGEIEERFVPVYLLHRYQVTAVARLLGGVRYGYTLAGEESTGLRTVDGPAQHAALRALVALLTPGVLTVPEHVQRVLVPPAIRYERTAEYLTPRRGLVFDPSTAVGAGAGLVAAQLLAPGRLGRLAWQHAADPSVPSPEAVVRATLDAAWGGAGEGSGVEDAVRLTAAWTVLQHVVDTLRSGGLHLPVDSAVRAELADAADRLDAVLAGRPGGAAGWAGLVRTARRAATAPGSVDLGPLPVVPPGAPI